ncbi:hypothetical protein PEA_00180 [Erwinia phage phiEa1H]|uniref:Uncharacterized protein n=2 Tax=Eracentumvirus era103 TaxID=1985737 RepID=E5AGI0_9CAUD|nr:hypothetical protein Era103g18 [Erwinia phage Era103]YP_007237542.1 hypothetical protein G172_gp19 [Erwinia phage phiEa100]ABM63408.1 hypothetical protein Era103g18 [Erwinia phage Era103]CBX44479.1 hypothetical protein PEA_00180 [Erwinia phage phiEa1H]CBX45082.1 hypothetical protein P100_00190 [Erwinia phage phiEa100]
MKQKNLHEVANLIRALLPVHGYIAGGAVRCAGHRAVL